jgi:hypothetical protein
MHGVGGVHGTMLTGEEEHATSRALSMEEDANTLEGVRRPGRIREREWAEGGLHRGRENRWAGRRGWVR